MAIARLGITKLGGLDIAGLGRLGIAELGELGRLDIARLARLARLAIANRAVGRLAITDVGNAGLAIAELAFRLYSAKFR